jgi:TRAP-type C4-dicarboxylate transport system substrate-binding protein
LYNDYLVNYEKEARKACEEAGLEFNVIEDKLAFMEMVEPIYDDYKERDPKIKAFIEMME